MKTPSRRWLGIWLVLAASGCGDLPQTGAKKPIQPEPRPAEADPEPPPAVATETPTPLPTPPAPSPIPASPSADQLAAYKAGYQRLTGLANDLDDFAFDRKGRMNDAQVKDYLARCSQEITKVETEVPALQGACEPLRSMITYASPLNTNMDVNKRLAGYQAAARAFGESMNRLTPKETR
jgi:hypothetical protein